MYLFDAYIYIYIYIYIKQDFIEEKQALKSTSKPWCKQTVQKCMNEIIQLTINSPKCKIVINCYEELEKFFIFYIFYLF